MTIKMLWQLDKELQNYEEQIWHYATNIFALLSIQTTVMVNRIANILLYWVLLKCLIQQYVNSAVGIGLKKHCNKMCSTVNTDSY
jgi:hypothetical protein